MNKAELIKEMAEELESKALAAAALNAILQNIEAALKAGDSLTLPGTATGMNARGDLVGTVLRTRYGSEGQPYLLTREGREDRLPLPKGASGTATAISNDGWITGFIDGLGVAWRP